MCQKHVLRLMLNGVFGMVIVENDCSQVQNVFLLLTELQELRGKVVKQIRANQQAESDLNLMDIKIGLLVKNRITLQVSLVLFTWLSS